VKIENNKIEATIAPCHEPMLTASPSSALPITYHTYHILTTTPNIDRLLTNKVETVLASAKVMPPLQADARHIAARDARL
jgi:hypothetical protein